MENFVGILWLLGALLPFILLQRALHREIQAVLLLLTRHLAITTAIFSLLFFPGVLLHELSHFLMARLLGVRTGGFSLLPRVQSNGTLQLGYVETAKSDILRDSLIGAAPLISGIAFLAYAAVSPLDLLSLWDSMRLARVDALILGAKVLPQRPDFWTWFYLAFVVSSTMLPSASDRHAWTPLALLLAALAGLAILAGAGPWMLTHLAPPLDSFLRAIALLFAFSASLHAILLLPFYLLHRLISRLTGLEVK